MPGPPAPMPLPQSFLAMLIPVIDPQRNGTAMHLQVISYFSRGLPIQAHQNPLDAQHYSRFLILLCLASKFQQLGDGGLISVRECWAHIAHHCSFFGVCRIIYAHLYRTQDLTDLKPSPHALEWQDLEFGVLIHFGPNTFLGKEWGDGTANPSTFKPTQFDPEQWMKAIKSAGARYVVMVAKHHDGFCLWPTNQT